MSAAAASAALPRLLLGADGHALAQLDRHLEVHGPLPDLGASERLLALVEESGLRGRGGASFPVARKLRAVAARRGPTVVVANGSESEPASAKDRLLLRTLPHLVLDGVLVAAGATGAHEAIVCLSAADEEAAVSLRHALRQRRDARIDGGLRIELFGTPTRYLSGQETALVRQLNGGPAKPTFAPPRPFERGVRRRPTLVQNVETLAHLALIARHGASWFRELGTPDDPGSALVTISGAVAAGGVFEIEHGTALATLLAAAGGASGAVRALLLGGYFGAWLPGAVVPDVRLADEQLARHGAALGCGVVVVLGAGACPVAEAVRIADYFANENAGQCGPCVNGLAAIAATLRALAGGRATRTAFADLARWIAELPGRGACHHPDGAVRFVASAVRVFADEFRDHAAHGPCDRCGRARVLPLPSSTQARAAA